ncbi:MAG: hypothetical protein ABEJ46_03835, partial [Gemmatimonadota bacterium]
MRPATSRLSALLVLLSLAVVPACSGGEGGNAGTDAAASGEEASPSATSAAQPSDSAHIWASRMMEALGGREHWEETRFLRFRWIVTRGGEEAANRFHAWDRWSGRYRLEYDRKDGSHVVALFNVNRVKSDSLEGAGHVWVGGERLRGAKRDSALRDAYSAFVNDSYWLLHPFKYFDPGVHLEYAGRTELSDGRSYPTVHLTFEPDLGVTTDQYWGYIDPETRRLHAWRYHLQGQEEKGQLIRWEGWERVGDIRLAPRRVW